MDATDPLIFASPPEDLHAAAEWYFGPRIVLAGRYAGSLATDGVIRGLIGPREAERVWERHVLNCAAIAPALPADARVIDVGSGAGLPGVVLAIARPDVRVYLVEPLGRRTVYLNEVVEALGLAGRVVVVRARAEDMAANPSMFHVKQADVVASRALAPLDRLAGWCLPLAAVGGRIMAMKGSSAADEIAAHNGAVRRIGGSAPILRVYGAETLPTPTTVVEIVRERVVGLARGRAESGRRSRRPSRRGRGGDGGDSAE